MDKAINLSKITEFIADRTKFETISDAPDKYTRKIEDKLNNFLRKTSVGMSMQFLILRKKLLTTRSLATRAAEHAEISVRTGVPLSQPSQSHIRDHLLTCGGPQIALNHFEIIGTCNNNSLELRILEYPCTLLKLNHL